MNAPHTHSYSTMPYLPPALLGWLALLVLTGCSAAGTGAEITPAAGPGLGATRISAQDGMAQVYVPAGEFLMGSAEADIDQVMQACDYCSRDWFKSEVPQHQVYLDAFWIDKTEVTNAMFTRFVAATGYQSYAEKVGSGIAFNLFSKDWKLTKGADWRHPFGPASHIDGLDDHPVVQINWADAQAYCNWAGGRLPTEAEWEKAARGTDGRTYPWGNQAPAENLVNFADRNIDVGGADRTVDDGYPFSAPVGSYPAGASVYGALDMAGNVWERVADWYSDAYYASAPARNPTGPAAGDYRVLRGGSWSRLARYVRAASRLNYLQQNRSSGIGFRCVR
jgi:formylglycine-generating enzyme required for sulfatase activity